MGRGNCEGGVINYELECQLCPVNNITERRGACILGQSACKHQGLPLWAGERGSPYQKESEESVKRDL